MRAVSKKRRREAKQRAHVRGQALSRDRGCVAKGLLPEIECGGRLEVNEIIRRSQWAAGYLDVDNTVTLCSEHHRYVTEHPVHAETLGLYRRGAGRSVQ